MITADVTVTAVRHDNWLFELAVGVAVCALALLRGRGPARAATAGLVVCAVSGVAGDVGHLPSQPGVAATLGLLVLGAVAVRTGAPRHAAAIAVAGVAVMVAGRVTLRPEYIAPFVFLGVLFWGAALALGVWLRVLDTRRHLAIDIARRDERLELARELHDVVAHHVAGIVVQAQAARIVAAKRPETLEDTLTGIESAGNDALAAMRQVVSVLRDPDDSGGVTPSPEQLTDLVGRFTSHGPTVELHLPDREQQSWPPEVATTVYRVVQEALTNVVLHAPDATNVTITVDNDDLSRVSVEVTDDAPTAASAATWLTHGGGHGLVGMRERVEALGGTLHAGPGGGSGWAVRATLPLPARSTK